MVMAKKQKVKTKSHKSRKYLWVITIIALFIFALAAYFWVYLPSQDRKEKIAEEKQQITKDQALLNNLADKIAKDYPPTSRESKNTCSYASQKFANGPLSCSVEVDLIYAGIDINRANEIMSGIAGKDGIEKQRESLYKKTSTFSILDDGYKATNFISNVVKENNSNECFVGYYFPASSLESGRESDEILIQLACIAPATQEYFPATNKNY